MTAVASKPQPRGTPLADEDSVLRVLLYPDDLNTDPVTNRQIVQANAFRPISSEQEETNGWLTVGGWVSVWDGDMTTPAQAARLTTNERRRYVVELNVEQVRDLTHPSVGSRLFNVMWDPLPECVTDHGFQAQKPGDLGHCGLSGLAQKCVAATLEATATEQEVKKRYKAIRKLITDLATASKHRLIPPAGEND